MLHTQPRNCDDALLRLRSALGIDCGLFGKVFTLDLCDNPERERIYPNEFDNFMFLVDPNSGAMYLSTSPETTFGCIFDANPTLYFSPRAYDDATDSWSAISLDAAAQIPSCDLRWKPKTEEQLVSTIDGWTSTKKPALVALLSERRSDNTCGDVFSCEDCRNDVIARFESDHTTDSQKSPECKNE